MNIPFDAMTILQRHTYPGRPSMYTVRFTTPRRAAKGERVTTCIRGAAYGGPIVEYDSATGGCTAQLFCAPQEEPTTP